MDLGSVRVKIEGDSTKLQADLKAAEVAAANAGGKIAQTFNKSAGSMNNTTATIKQVASGITQTGEAAEKAGKKVQSFVGAIPGMGVAAERFIGLIPGLGQAMIAAFPVFGAVAFAAGLGRVAEGVRDIANEWDPVISAEKRAKEVAKEFGDEILKIRKHLQEMGDVKFGESFGKFAMEGKQAVDKTSEILALRARVKAAEDDVSQARREGAAGGGVAAVAGTVLPGMNIVADMFAKGAKINAETRTRELLVLQNKLREAIEEQQAFADKSGEILVDSMVSAADKRKAASDKARSEDRTALKAGMQQMLDDLKDDHQLQIGEEQLFWETRAAEVKQSGSQYNQIVREINHQIAQLQQQSYREMQAATEKDDAAKERHADQMAEQQQRWKKINIDAASPDRFQQVKIDVPLMERLKPALADKITLNKAGIDTIDQREEEIASKQELLRMAESINVPLGTQLRMREQILQQQIDLKAAQGQSVSAELQALDALQAQMDRMHQKTAGIAPLLHNLRGIGAQIPGQLGGALAGGIMGGNPGKNIGQEIRGALQGIGQQILGTIFQRAIEQLVVSLGLNTLANTVLQALFPVQQGSTAALIGALALNTAAVTAQATTTGVGAGVGAAGAAAGIAGSVGSAASGGLLGGVISGVISAAGSLVSAFLIIRAIHGTTAEVRALRKSGGIKPGGGGISGADAEKPAQAGYMSSLAKIFGADAVRVNIVAVSPLAFTNGLFSVLGNLFGFADGGRPPLGRPSIVGERGPELFIPDQAGRIIANGGSGLSFPVASSNGGGITIGSITANGVNNPREFVREVARQLPAYLKSTNPKYSPASR